MIKHTKKLFYNEWNKNTLLIAEAVSILDLIHSINQYQVEISSGELVIFTNSKKIRNYILNKQYKASKFVGDAGATLVVIKHEIEYSLIRIEVEYNKGKLF